MKTYGNLWEHVTDTEQLYLAYRRARRCKRNSSAMASLAYDLESQLTKLRQELRDGSYKPSGYRSFSIIDPKPRKIYAAAFRDRIVHHSLVAAIEPIFDRAMISDNYACRVGKGTHMALRALDHHWRACEVTGPAFILRLDISKFFFNIPHDKLIELVNRRLREPEMKRLVGTIVDSINTGATPNTGIPIGNLLWGWIKSSLLLDKFPGSFSYHVINAYFINIRPANTYFLGRNAIRKFFTDFTNIVFGKFRSPIAFSLCVVS